MPRKKQMTYGDMAKELAGIQERMAGERERMARVMCEGLLTGEAAEALAGIQERMAGERERMARVMCEGLLTGEAAEALGYCSDADLRKIMGYIAADMGKYVARLEVEKEMRAKAREAKAARAAFMDGFQGADHGPDKT